MNDYLNSEEFRKAYAKHEANERRVMAAQHKADRQRPASGVRQQYEGVKANEQVTSETATMRWQDKRTAPSPQRKRSSSDYKRTKIQTTRNY